MSEYVIFICIACSCDSVHGLQDLVRSNANIKSRYVVDNIHATDTPSGEWEQLQ